MPRRATDPYAGFRFKLQLGSVSVAGFSECTGLGVETKLTEYKEGGNNFTTLKFPEHTTYSNVALKRGVTRSNELVTWQLSVATGLFAINPRQSGLNVAIILQDEKGAQVKRWRLIRAIPVKWQGPDMKASSSDVAIETLELAHEGVVPG